MKRRTLSRRTAGFSLVELMVAVAINLVVVVAASYLYLATRETQRTNTEKAVMFENGNYALELIGRELENAGFYPALSVEDSTKALVLGHYLNVVSGTPAAYNAGVFGCDAQVFLPVTSVCGAHPGTTAPDADSLVVNYFTNDSLSLDAGQRADCQRQDVGAAATNALRVGTSTVGGLPPSAPLFVSNRYTLVPTTMQVEGQAISTFSIACNGNGVAPQVDTYQPIVAGIDQMRFRYGAFSSATTLQPDNFLTAANVTLLAPVTLGGETRAGWGRVVAVRACLLVRSLQRAKVSLASYTITDCDGASQTFTDGVERKVFMQVFAVKNHIPQTYPVH